MSDERKWVSVVDVEYIENVQQRVPGPIGITTVRYLETYLYFVFHPLKKYPTTIFSVKILLEFSGKHLWGKQQQSMRLSGATKFQAGKRVLYPVSRVIVALVHRSYRGSGYGYERHTYITFISFGYGY